MQEIITITQHFPKKLAIGYFTKICARLGIPDQTQQKTHKLNCSFHQC